MTSGNHDLKYDYLSFTPIPVFMSHIYLNKTGRLLLYRTTSLVQKYTVQQISLGKVSIRNLVRPKRVSFPVPHGSNAFPQTAD